MTTSYERLREECNKRLPERLELKFGCEVETYIYPTYPVYLTVINEQYKSGVLVCVNCDDDLSFISKHNVTILGTPLTITDVLRVLAATRAKATSFYIEDDGNLWQCTAPLGDNLLCKFTLSLPLSAPENEAACEAVLAMLTTNP